MLDEGNYTHHASDGIVAVRAVPHPLDSDSFPHIKQIYNAFAQGKNPYQVKEECNVGIGYIDEARRHLIQKHPDLYKQIAGEPRSSHHFLLDENMFYDDQIRMSQRIVALWHDFGRVTHGNMEGLQGSSDKGIWSWARQQHRRAVSGHAIISQDIRMGSEHKDLSMIALHRAHKKIHLKMDRNEFYDTRHIPILVQITPHTSNPNTMMHTLRKNSDAIVDFMDNPTSAILRVTPHGAEPFLSYEEIAMQSWGKLKAQAEKLNYQHRQKIKIYTNPSPLPS